MQHAMHNNKPGFKGRTLGDNSEASFRVSLFDPIHVSTGQETKTEAETETNMDFGEAWGT